jgi:hypothetical protein
MAVCGQSPHTAFAFILVTPSSIIEKRRQRSIKNGDELLTHHHFFNQSF